ncbi:MAG: hypothetical protein JO021_19945 [Alphaproteobacteria bacterium]|nr:hypothetical protein [Alphaproteobacteria bacterium]
MRLTRALLPAALAVALSGCASLINKMYDDVSLNSDPSGAECRVERMGQPVAQLKSTPGIVRIPRDSHPVDIFCWKDGETGARTVAPSFDPWAFANLPVAYVFDSITDGDAELPQAILVRFPTKTTP